MKRILLIFMIVLAYNKIQGQVYIDLIATHEFYSSSYMPIPEDVYLKDIQYFKRIADSTAISFNYKYCNYSVGSYNNYGAYYLKSYYIEVDSISSVNKVNPGRFTYTMVEVDNKDCNGNKIIIPIKTNVYKDVTLQWGAGLPPDYHIYSIYPIKELQVQTHTLDTTQNLGYTLTPKDKYLKDHPVYSSIMSSGWPSGTFSNYYEVAPLVQTYVGIPVWPYYMIIYGLGPWEKRSSINTYRSIVGTHNDWLGRELVLRYIENVKDKTYSTEERRFMFLRRLKANASIIQPTCPGGNGQVYLTFPELPITSEMDIHMLVTLSKYNLERSSTKADSIKVGSDYYYFFDSNTKDTTLVNSNTLVINESTFGKDWLKAGIFKIEVDYLNKDKDNPETLPFKMDLYLNNPPQFTANLSYSNTWGTNYHIGSCQTDGSLNLSGITNGTAPYKITNESKTTIPGLGNVASGAFQLSYANYNGAKIKLIDNKGCLAKINSSDTSFLVNFNKPTTPISLSIDQSSVTNVLCNGKSTGEIPFIINGDIPVSSYTVSAIPSPTIDNINKIIKNLPADTYNITAIDASGCSDTKSGIVVTQPSTLPSITKINTVAPTCKGFNNGAITSVEASGGTGPNYEYNVDNSSWKSISSSTSGFYGSESHTVYLRDQNGCEASLSVPKTIPADPPQLYAGVRDILDKSCSAINNGHALVKPLGGTPSGSGYNILLTDNSGVTTTSVEKSDLQEKTYNLTVRDSKLCQTDTSFKISVVSKPLSIGIPSNTDAWCENKSNGTSSVPILLGDRMFLPYQVSLSGDKNRNHPETSDITVVADTFINLPKGNYTVSIQDKSGCQASQDFIIDYDSNRVNLSDTSTSAAKCLDTNTGKVHAKANAGYPFTGSEFLYNLYNKAGVKVSFIQAPEANFDYSNGSYTVEVVDSRGCTSSKSGKVSSEPNPVHYVRLDSVPQSCNGINNGSYTLTAVSAFTIDSIYQIGFKAKNSLPFTLLNKTANSYTVRAIDNMGCKNDTTVAIVNLGNEPIAFFKDTLLTACSKAKNGGIQIAARQKQNKASFDFSLNGVGVDSLKHSTDSVMWFRNLKYGNYVAEVKDKDGCIGSTNLYLPIIADSVAIINKTTLSFVSATCIRASNATLNVSANGGINQSSYKFYLLNDKRQQVDLLVGKTVPFKGLYPRQSYYVKVMDDYQCSDSTALFYPPVIPATDTLKLSLRYPTNPSCIDSVNGKALLDRKNGTPFSKGYKFEVFDVDGNIVKAANYGADTLVTLKGFPQGSYKATVTDSVNCLASADFIISDPLPMEISVVDTVKVKAKGKPQGLIRANITKGNYKYDYQWYKVIDADHDVLLADNTTGLVVPSGSINLEELNLYAGDYKLLVRDTAHCIYEGTKDWMERRFTIREPKDTLDIIRTFYKKVSCKNGNDGRFDYAGKGGWGGYSYSIDRKSWDYIQTQNPLYANNYKVYVKDVEGVIDSLSVSVVQPAQVLQADTSSTVPALCYNSSDGKVFLTIMGGNDKSPYTVFPITDSLKSQNVTTNPAYFGLPQGKHTLVVKDTLGCRTTLTAIVKAPSQMVMTDTTFLKSACQFKNGSILVAVDGGTPGYAYLWKYADAVRFPKRDTSFTTKDGTNLYSGPYRLVVTDTHSCRDSFLLSLDDITDLTIDNVLTQRVWCPGDSSGKASIQVSKGNPPYLITWVDKYMGTQVSGLPAGTNYYVRVSDSKGCNVSSRFAIDSLQQLSIPSRSVIQPLCLGGYKGELSITANGGTNVPGYSYAWSNGDRGNSVSNLNPGTYIVTVTDGHNCYKPFPFVLNYQKTIKPNLGPDLTLCSGNEYSLSPGSYALYKWNSDNGFISSDSVVKINIPGKYSVEVTDIDDCIGNDTMKLSISSNSLNAEFLMASEIVQNDTLMVIESSWPVPDSIRWNLPGSARIIAQGEYYKQMIMPDTGTFSITLRSFRYDCFDQLTKQVEVHPRTQSVSQKKSAASDMIKKFSLYPNPSSGNFTVEINLKEAAEATLKVVSLSQGRVMHEKLVKGSDVYIEYYSLPDLPIGAYVLYLQVGKDSKTLTFIKQ